jgi:hypothetical protein
MARCDYKNCDESATTKGFVQLRDIDPVTGSKYADVNACDKHKEKDGFFPYVKVKK